MVNWNALALKLSEGVVLPELSEVVVSEVIFVPQIKNRFLIF